MPLYFFDTIENGQITRDDLGVDMSPADMRREAKRLLPSLVIEHSLPADLNDFAVWVRDDTGRCVYEASLTLVTRSLSAPA
ncbi:hypothetical protein C7I87_02350 [Mesorhizobium sp. SARCC-RB16n]|uniref:DUF6894 family protein n=1 Tax=Mesorhizobium sp. SARCC-RB16n TaxID=2116687 RepID=UPI00122EE17D|nr:hypothetical protein [Mesorhizobium sp. SARCC-RB16n]KAA3452253.1 hypothetical protein C7I87_02350 [Mesorhizobium sp. SARCC-RB16n]